MGLKFCVCINLRSGVIYFCLFASLAREGKKITKKITSSRERHKGMIGRGHDLRLCVYVCVCLGALKNRLGQVGGRKISL